jgi:hypothetical protein
VHDERHVFLALWRRNDDGTVEFFVPLDGYAETMSFVVLDGAARTARRVVKSQFGLELKSNARVFRRSCACVVALNLTFAEQDILPNTGQWLPLDMITDLAIALTLKDVIGHL